MLRSFRIPRAIQHGTLRLRPLRFFDIPLLQKGLRPFDMRMSAGQGRPALRWRLSVWWWLKRNYPILFCVEAESKCIGFIGLYNLCGESAEITLIVSDSRSRRLGYGSGAYHALIAHLPRSSFITKFTARIKADNHPSMSFWRALGFEEQDSLNGITTMAKDLERNAS